MHFCDTYRKRVCKKQVKLSYVEGNIVIYLWKILFYGKKGEHRQSDGALPGVHKTSFWEEALKRPS